MGLQSGGKCIYKSKPISLGDLYKVLEDRRDSRLTTNDTSKRKPSLDIDANNIGFVFLSKAAGPMGSLFQVALILAEAGIDITLVADPPSRHHSKRASIKRRSNIERARLECIDLQAQLAALLQGETPPPAESIRQFERKIQSKQNESMRSLPDDFAPALRHLCQQYEPKLPTQ